MHSMASTSTLNSMPGGSKNKQDSIPRTVPPSSSHGRGSTVPEKVLMHNVFDYIRSTNPTMSIDEVTQATATAVGLSEKAIIKMRQEFKRNGKFLPSKTRNAFEAVHYAEYGDQSMTELRRMVHEYYFRYEKPTVEKIIIELAMCDLDIMENLPTKPKYSAKRDLSQKKNIASILKDMGFITLKRQSESLLVENDYVITARYRYLETIRKLRELGRPIYYVHQLWLNANEEQNRRMGFKRLMILDIGNENGCIPKARVMFPSNSKLDFPPELNTHAFETWFEKIAREKLQQNSVIVMENAPPQSRVTEGSEHTFLRKQSMRDWLTKAGVKWNTNMPKALLSGLIKRVQSDASSVPNYCVDLLASRFGHTVVRLPSFHWDLNIVATAYTQVVYDLSVNPSSVFTPLDTAVSVTVESLKKDFWETCEQQVICEEARLTDLQIILDNLTDEFIHVNGGDNNIDTGCDDTETTMTDPSEADTVKDGDYETDYDPQGTNF